MREKSQDGFYRDILVPDDAEERTVSPKLGTGFEKIKIFEYEAQNTVNVFIAAKDFERK